VTLTFQSYVSSHPGTVLLDPLPAMTQLLDRFASYGIMSKLHNSLRGELDLQQSWSPRSTVAEIDVHTCPSCIFIFLSTDWRICSPPYLEVHSAADLSSIEQTVTTRGLSFPLSQFTPSAAFHFSENLLYLVPINVSVIANSVYLIGLTICLSVNEA